MYYSPHLVRQTHFWTELLRVGCELMIILFLIDEYTDVENATKTAEIVDIAIDALKNPQQPRPEGEVILGEVIRQSVITMRIS